LKGKNKSHPSVFIAYDK